MTSKRQQIALRSSNQEWYSQCLALPCKQTKPAQTFFDLTGIRKKAHLPTKPFIHASYLSWHSSTFLSPASSVSAQGTKGAAECLRQLRSEKSLWGKCCQSHKRPKCHWWWEPRSLGRYRSRRKPGEIAKHGQPLLPRGTREMDSR